MNQKKESAGVFIWRLLYPVLIFLGVEITIEMIVMYGYMYHEISRGNITAEEIGASSEIIEDFVHRSSIYITIARSAVLIPLYLFFMKRDVARDKVYGRYTKYSDYDGKWLVLVPIAGFTAAVGFNHVVPFMMEALQNAINVIGRSWFGKSGLVDFFSTYDDLSQIIYSGGIAVQILATAVAAPIVEEFLFRGLIFKRLRDSLKFVPSTLLSALLFGIIHANALQFAYAFILGLLLAYIYEQFKSVWAPVLFHAGANLISVIVTAIVPEEGIGLGMGGYMLLTVVELAVTFLLLWVIKLKVNRKPLDNEER